jgi:hypothetical protein
MSFDNRSRQSGAERARAAQLEAMAEAGQITNLIHHPRVELSAAKIGWDLDFSYTDERGVDVYEDCKGLRGFDSEALDIKKKLWAAYGPAPLRITHRRENGAFIVRKTIFPPIQALNGPDSVG